MLTALAVEAFALRRQAKDRSERGVVNSPTPDFVHHIGQNQYDGQSLGAHPKNQERIVERGVKKRHKKRETNVSQLANGKKGKK